MNLELAYGHGTLPLSLPDGAKVDIFEPGKLPPLDDVAVALRQALAAPVDCFPLAGRTTPKSIAIAVPDETRPVPLKLLLPPLLQEIFAIFPLLNASDIRIVVGGGLHPPADAAQLDRILPRDLPGCTVVSHDAEHSPVASFGVTSRGTPVEVNEAFGTAELKLVIGMVDAHQFVGFTGGSKGAVIGCASARMIAANHGLMRQDGAEVAHIESNPVRLDLDEAGERVGVAMSVNVVLDAKKKTVAVLAGKPASVMRKASEVTRKLYGMPFSAPYDIVVASCGGSPKDICLYQAQKGLTTAMQCAAPNAHIILIAECGQGIGDDAYHNYVRQFSSDRELKSTFETGKFAMGAHKAYLFARATTRFNVVVHSDLPDATLAECLLTPGDLQRTVERLLTENPKARIAVIKNANSSFFHKVDVSARS